MISKNALVIFLFANFLVVTTIGLAQVNHSTLLVFPIIRQLAIAACGAGLIVFHLLVRPKLESGISLALLIALYSIAILQSGHVFMSEIGLRGLSIAFLIVATGTFLFPLDGGRAQYVRLAVFFQIYSGALLLFVFLTGGLTFSPVPAFRFDIIAESGSVVTYNQGATSFFGLAALFSLWLALTVKSLTVRILHVGLSIFFILISFIGGGRGDFAALVAVGFFMLATNGLKVASYSIVLGALSLSVLFFSFLDVLSDTDAFSRFQAVFQQSDFGLRDRLFLEAFNLLLDEPRCLFFGCGFAFFQEYYRYPYGLYPHNIALEALITWGAIVVLPILVLFVLGVSDVRRSLGAFFWAGIYFILIGMKSGDVINTWMAMSFIIFVSAVGMKKLLIRLSHN